MIFKAIANNEEVRFAIKRTLEALLAFQPGGVALGVAVADRDGVQLDDGTEVTYAKTKDNLGKGGGNSSGGPWAASPLGIPAGSRGGRAPRRRTSDHRTCSGTPPAQSGRGRRAR